MRARTYALQFDRMHVFDQLMGQLADGIGEELSAL